MPKLFCQLWSFTESGDGPDFKRPDGYSLHVTLEILAQFKQSNHDGSCPQGLAYPIDVSVEEWSIVHKTKYGVRRYSTPPSNPQQGEGMSERKAICQAWFHYDRYDPTRKASPDHPDGFSLHFTEKDHETFLKQVKPGRGDYPKGEAYKVELCSEHFDALCSGANPNGVRIRGPHPELENPA